MALAAGAAAFGSVWSLWSKLQWMGIILLVAFIAAGPVIGSCVLSFVIAFLFIYFRPENNQFTYRLWTWFRVGSFQPGIGFYLDALTVEMISVVSFVAMLIFLYSLSFMYDDDGYSRYFAYMNLFVGSMLTLVMADNLLLLYLGWEGVGLCSYLLIGFWYREPENIRAAMKAFVVTRIGDMLLAIGLFLFYVRFHTLQIQPAGSAFCTGAALLMLGGAIGKSAQLPLQVWLPDAMAGPSPVSALIHAATMVIAGVYLIARLHVLFSMAPAVMTLVAIVGTVTLVLAGFSALVQKDIKRVLAYSTISQIGYMFLALGAGAWAAGIYHFITHALFKSSLFLGAGVLIQALGGEHDIFKMGGMRKQFPVLFPGFLAATMTLAAVPPLTLTFNSKDIILNRVWTSSATPFLFWLGGMLGAFLTAAYAYRLLLITFFGEPKTKVNVKPSNLMIIPLTILAFLAAISGLPELIRQIFGTKTFYDFLYTALPDQYTSSPLPVNPWLMQALYAGVSLTAMGLVYWLHRGGHALFRRYLGLFLVYQALRYLRAGFGFDWIYDKAIVRPYDWITRLNRFDVVNWVTISGVYVTRLVHLVFSLTVNGNLRWYAACIGIGSILLLWIVLFS